MEILVLGGTGMLGHKMFQRLRERFPETYCTIRGAVRGAELEHVELFQAGNVCEYVDAADFAALQHLLRVRQPKVIVNCMGIVKQRREAQEALPSILVNALLPHRLAETCRAWGGQVIHISTDCVFSGKVGHYSEDDPSDADDVYGRRKHWGDWLGQANALTLRTSMIGRELFHFQSLLEWFLGQDDGRVRGYQRAMYSGATTTELAAVVGESFSTIRGYWALSGHRTNFSKYELLSLLRDAYGLDVEVIPDNELFCDRSMNGEKFCAATGYVSAGWPQLATELAGDETPYEQWRRLKHEVL